ncbi:MAG: class I SAM-dependent methyltransferase [Fulvivirga sp.]|uniref:class I SAM-dependent methyltransferase n=1 Tax=Fulvivirga sp. TaxID=1931237 RepID=UPI0032EB62F8
MIEELLKPNVQKFIKANENADPFDLSLNHKEVEGVPIQEIAQQIAARKKAKLKLPSWYTTNDIIYPPKLSIEQSSSELTANYKASLVQGKSFVDLTAGMGVDAWAFSKQIDNGVCVEQSSELANITSHNIKTLGVQNVSIVNTLAAEFLATNKQQFDLVYLDPARRDKHARKVFTLEDCTPNIIELLPNLKKHGKQTLVKTAPLMDIDLSIKSLPGVRHVYVVSVNNECKEVLYLIDSVAQAEPIITATNLEPTNTSEFVFTYQEEATAEIHFGQLKAYLYELNASIMKAGAFKTVAAKFNLEKLHANTHLYTSVKLINDFPGRMFSVKHLINYNKKEFKQLGIKEKINVSTRNFPDTPEQIKKKLGLQDGGDYYLFGFTDIDNKKKLAICTKVSKS